MRVSVLLRCPEEDLDKNETLYIEALDTIHPRGYNLRCGSHAARPTSENALSTFVHEPIVYDDADDMAATVKAVMEDVAELKGGDTLSWSGPIKISVESLNSYNGAKQFLPWAGPVKGVSVDENALVMEIDKKKHLQLTSLHRQVALTFEMCGNEFVSECKRDQETKLASALASAELKINILKTKIKTAKELGLVEELKELKRTFMDTAARLPEGDLLDEETLQLKKKQFRYDYESTLHKHSSDATTAMPVIQEIAEKPESSESHACSVSRNHLSTASLVWRPIGNI
jgi:hypothetical protein